MENNTKLFLCSCGLPEHQLLARWLDDEDGFIYIHYHLSPAPFWKRVKNAVQHIMGKRSRYGDFGELVIEPTDVNISNLKDMMDHLIKMKEKSK